MARRRDPGAHHREAGREEEPHGDQDADEHHLAEPRPDALGHRLAGAVVFGEGDREHQVGEQAGPSEEEGDHEEDPHQRGVEADVLGEAARDAPDLPIVSRPEEGASGADLFFFSFFCLVVFWLFCHGSDDDGPGHDRLSGITPSRPPSSPRRTTPDRLYARVMAERRIVGSHFNRQGKPKRGYVKEEVAKAEAARFGMTYYRCDVCETLPPDEQVITRDTGDAGSPSSPLSVAISPSCGPHWKPVYICVSTGHSRVLDGETTSKWQGRSEAEVAPPRPADVFVIFGITGDLAKVMTLQLALSARGPGAARLPDRRRRVRRLVGQGPS